MKRRKLIKHLKRHGCQFLREGARHAVYVNLANGLQAPVERHIEIKPTLVHAICEELGIPVPRER